MGITRDVFFWYSPKLGIYSTIDSQEPVALGSPRPRRRRARASCPRRFLDADVRIGEQVLGTRPDAPAAPPMDAMTYVSAPSKNGTTGTVRDLPDLLPTVVSRRIFRPCMVEPRRPPDDWYSQT